MSVFTNPASRSAEQASAYTAAVLDLLGASDVITRTLYDSIDYHKTWTNAYTAGEVAWARVPVVADTDRDAVAFALCTARRVQPETARVVWIKNTLELEHLSVSESLRRSHPDAAEWLGPEFCNSRD